MSVKFGEETGTPPIHTIVEPFTKGLQYLWAEPMEVGHLFVLRLKRPNEVYQ